MSASFDVSTLFGEDRAPAQALASQAKNGGPDFIKEIGLGPALVKVRPAVPAPVALAARVACWGWSCEVLG